MLAIYLVISIMDRSSISGRLQRSQALFKTLFRLMTNQGSQYAPLTARFKLILSRLRMSSKTKFRILDISRKILNHNLLKSIMINTKNSWLISQISRSRFIKQIKQLSKIKKTYNVSINLILTVSTRTWVSVQVKTKPKWTVKSKPMMINRLKCSVWLPIMQSSSRTPRKR